MSKVLLRAENISRRFFEPGNSIVAVQGVNLTIQEADYVALAGPSGAGKSTLLHILGGLDKPSRGRVLFDSEDIYSFSSAKRSRFLNKKTGFVFQFYHLLPELTVRENIILPILISGLSKKRAVFWAEPIMEELGITNRADFYPAQLSGGEKQRASLARALINRPAVLFCDEPTGNLDADSAEVIRQILKRLNSRVKTAIVMATHNLKLAKDAKRVLNIEAGRIVGESRN